MLNKRAFPRQFCAFVPRWKVPMRNSFSRAGERCITNEAPFTIYCTMLLSTVVVTPYYFSDEANKGCYSTGTLDATHLKE